MQPWQSAVVPVILTTAPHRYRMKKIRLYPATAAKATSADLMPRENTKDQRLPVIPNSTKHAHKAPG